MLTRVETLKRNSTQQASYFQNFDERLQRLEDMQTSTIQLLNVLIQNIETRTNDQGTLIESTASKTLETKIDDDNNDEALNFTAVSTPDDVALPLSSLLSSSGSRPMRSGSFTTRKVTNSLPISNTAPPQIVVGSYQEFLAMKNTTTLTANDERLGIAATTLSASSTSINVPDDTSHLSLYAAEETEHNIYGKLIKERFRKLSEVVEDIERTLPSHQQRQDEKCDTTDDDETLSTMDWVDTTGRTTYNSTRVSRFDINQDEHGHQFIATSKNIL
jgi:hypothetical protein